MATTLTDLIGTLLAGVNLTGSRAGDLSVNQSIVNAVERTSLTFGEDDDEANQIYEDSGTVGTESTVTLSIGNGSIYNPFGGEVAFDSLKAVYIKNTGIVDILLDGLCQMWRSAAKEEETIPPGGVVMRTAPDGGWAVSPACTIALENESAVTAATYDIVLVGVEET